MSEVIFKNVKTGFCVNGGLFFKGGKFVSDNSSSSNLPGSNPVKSYSNIVGLSVDVSNLEKKKLSEEIILISAYGFALNIFSLICAKYQTYMYFSDEIFCEYKNILWILVENHFEKYEEYKKTMFVGGGEGFCDDISFLNTNKNPKRLLHFYRVARDENKPIDYRVLQIWRFFEAWFKMKDSNLKNKLIDLKFYEEIGGWDINTNKRIIYKYKISKGFINRFYGYFRCAVSHGGGSRTRDAKKVYYPLLLDFDIQIEDFLEKMIDIASYLLKNTNKYY